VPRRYVLDWIKHRCNCRKGKCS